MTRYPSCDRQATHLSTLDLKPPGQQAWSQQHQARHRRALLSCSLAWQRGSHRRMTRVRAQALIQQWLVLQGCQRILLPGAGVCTRVRLCTAAVRCISRCCRNYHFGLQVFPKASTLIGDVRCAAGPAGDGASLREELEKLVALEAVTYSCGACQRQRTTHRQLSLRCLPPVLVVHVKRFHNNRAKVRLMSCSKPCQGTIIGPKQ